MHRASVRLGEPFYPDWALDSRCRLMPRDDEEKLSQNRESIGRLYSSMDEKSEIVWKEEFKPHALLAFRDADGKQGFMLTNKSLYHEIISVGDHDIKEMNESPEYADFYCKAVQRNRNFELGDKNYAESVFWVWMTTSGVNNPDLPAFSRKFTGAIWFDYDEALVLQYRGDIPLQALEALEFEFEHNAYIAQKFDGPRSVLLHWKELLDIGEPIDMATSNIIMSQYFMASYVMLLGIIKAVDIYYEEKVMHPRIKSIQFTDKFTCLDPHKGDQFKFGDGKGQDPWDTFDILTEVRKSDAIIAWEETVEISKDGVNFILAREGIDYYMNGDKIMPASYVIAYRITQVKKELLPDYLIKFLSTCISVANRIDLDIILKQDMQSLNYLSARDRVCEYIPSPKKLVDMHDEVSDGPFRITKANFDNIGRASFRILNQFWIPHVLIEQDGIPFEVRGYDITTEDFKDDMPLKEQHLVSKISGDNCKDSFEEYKSAWEDKWYRKMEIRQIKEVEASAKDLETKPDIEVIEMRTKREALELKTEGVDRDDRMELLLLQLDGICLIPYEEDVEMIEEDDSGMIEEDVKMEEEGGDEGGRLSDVE